MTKRREYSDQFKAKVALEALRGDCQTRWTGVAVTLATSSSNTSGDP